MPKHHKHHPFSGRMRTGQSGVPDLGVWHSVCKPFVLLLNMIFPDRSGQSTRCSGPPLAWIPAVCISTCTIQVLLVGLEWPTRPWFSLIILPYQLLPPLFLLDLVLLARSPASIDLVSRSETKLNDWDPGMQETLLNATVPTTLPFYAHKWKP